MRFEGLFTALITPFKEDGSVDVAGFLQNISEQIDAGVHGLLLFGSTGEGASLLPAEIDLLGREAVKEFKGTIPLIFGASHCNLHMALHNTAQAEKLGADGVILTPPYYLKPTQEGIYRFYQQIARSTSLPLILYNNPSRCGVSLEKETVHRLKEIPTIVAVKESANHVDAFSRSPLPVLIGDDTLFLPGLALGACGLVSVLSNLYPHTFAEIYTLAQENNFHSARKLYLELEPSVALLSLESNPIVIKKMMQIHGKASGSPRLPLTPATPKTESLLIEYAQKPILC